MTTSGDTSSLLRSQISAQSIQVPQTVTQQQTPTSQIFTPMQSEMPELVLPSTSSTIDKVVEREKDKKTKKRFANQSMVIEELGNTTRVQEADRRAKMKQSLMDVEKEMEPFTQQDSYLTSSTGSKYTKKGKERK